jgi:hypothetical protein
MKTEPWEGRRDWSQTQPLKKKKWLYACRPFETNILKEGAMWCIDLLLGKDLEINNKTNGKHASTTIELPLEMVLCNPLLGSCSSWSTTVETGVFSM